MPSLSPSAWLGRGPWRRRRPAVVDSRAVVHGVLNAVVVPVVRRSRGRRRRRCRRRRCPPGRGWRCSGSCRSALACPSPSSSGSQASPRPSPSVSAWSGLATTGQLSAAFEPSVDVVSPDRRRRRCRRRRRRPGRGWRRPGSCRCVVVDPVASLSGSQASPRPSPSLSSWPGLATAGSCRPCPGRRRRRCPSRVRVAGVAHAVAVEVRLSRVVDAGAVVQRRRGCRHRRYRRPRRPRSGPGRSQRRVRAGIAGARGHDLAVPLDRHSPGRVISGVDIGGDHAVRIEGRVQAAVGL